VTSPELPARVLVDTGVILRWLDPAKDDRAPACAELVDTLLHERREVLVAAPSVAEVLRFGPGTAVPHRRGLTVVSFDDEAARVVGSKLPFSALEVMNVETGVSKSRLKFDALIVACAIRHKASVVVSLDAGCRAVGTRMGIRALSPPQLLQAQTVLQGILLPPT